MRITAKSRFNYYRGTGLSPTVRGVGVIGEQPLIAPGMQYVYISGTVLSIQIGSMRSSYQMIGSDGVAFEAIIPMFRPFVPGVLH